MKKYVHMWKAVTEVSGPAEQVLKWGLSSASLLGGSGKFLNLSLLKWLEMHLKSVSDGDIKHVYVQTHCHWWHCSLLWSSWFTKSRNSDIKITKPAIEICQFPPHASISFHDFTHQKNSIHDITKENQAKHASRRNHGGPQYKVNYQ